MNTTSFAWSQPTASSRARAAATDGLLAVLPLLARLCGGGAMVADAGGHCLRGVDRHGAPIPALEGLASPLARAVSLSGQPEWEEDEATGMIRVAFPVDGQILEISNDSRIEHQAGLLATLKQTLPLIARVAGGEAVLFDREGRRILTADPVRGELLVGSGSPSDPCAGVMRTGQPDIGKSSTVAGAMAVRIPLTPDFGFGFNNAAAVSQKQRLLDQVRSQLSAKYNWEDIVGDSAITAKAVAQAKAAARSSAPVFLIGESGTGKELFAQAIHNASPRRDGPFVAINCSALPESLAESTLFGYVEGTFTGAYRGGRPGLFEQASGGTLLLDEITEMTVEIQAKLLRVIQEREVCRIGSVKPIPVDIRLIATTNRDLERHVRDGHFREDLYYRLNVIDIALPSLRARRDDIPAIVAATIDGLFRSGGRFIREVHPEALRWLMEQSWPGNIRELRNVLERAVNLASGDVLYLHDIARADPTLAPAERAAPDAAPARSPLSDRVALAEEVTILEALQRNKGHRGRTAIELGISTTTLWRRLRRVASQGVSL